MILFHASTSIIQRPDVFHSRDLLDFGKGFYLTQIEEQTRKYALRFTLQGYKAYLNYYEFDDISGYNVKTFESYNEEWLDYVTMCRIGKILIKYDVVAGGIADDKVFNTIDLYFSGNISKDEALKRLTFIHPNHQICILSQEVLDNHLHFIKAEVIL